MARGVFSFRTVETIKNSIYWLHGGMTFLSCNILWQVGALRGG